MRMSSPAARGRVPAAMRPAAPGRPPTRAMNASEQPMRHACLSSSQRRALLRPFSCNTVIGGHSPAKLRQVPCTRKAVRSSRRGKSQGISRNDCKLHRPTTAAAPPAARAGALDRATFLRPIAHRGLHDRRQGPHREHGSRLPCGHRQGLRHRVRPAGGQGRHADGLPRRQARSAHGRSPGRISLLTAREPARLRYKGQDEHILTFAELLGPRRRPGAAAGGGQDQQPPRRSTRFLDRIARQARAYKGPIALMSFDLDVVAALAKLAPTIPRGPVIGSHPSAELVGDAGRQRAAPPSRACSTGSRPAAASSPST